RLIGSFYEQPARGLEPVPPARIVPRLLERSRTSADEACPDREVHPDGLQYHLNQTRPTAIAWHSECHLHSSGNTRPERSHPPPTRDQKRRQWDPCRSFPRFRRWISLRTNYSPHC